MSKQTAAQRARSNSLQQGLAQMPSQVRTASPRATFMEDIWSSRWLTNPATSLKIVLATVATWFALEVLPLPFDNPLTPALFISYPLPLLSSDEGIQRYSKGPRDIAFLAFYIIVFSFVRQGTTEFALRPLARFAGLSTDAKQVRFMEQAYAIVYNLCTAALGLSVMYGGKSWWYQTEHLWLEFPHWRMSGVLKWYYLLQAAYWLQQMLVLGLRLEKPRSDYAQLVIHHMVTLWLVGWSYATNLTVIGVCIFVSMDIPEIFLASSKCFNYIGWAHTSEFCFVCLLGFWTYMRHYLNLRILWSVWNQFDLIPAYQRTWTAPASNPSVWWIFSETGLVTGRMPSWMRVQIFLPIFLLQLVNAFWSYLLWRILYRLVVGFPLTDIREEGEDEETEGGAVAAAGDETKKER